MIRICLVPALLGVCLGVACAPPQPEIDLAAEEQAIRKLTADWFADEIRRDMEASLSYLAPDAVIQPEGAPTIVGIAAMRSLYEEFFKIPYADVVMEPRTVVVAASGDLAYDIGPWKMVFEGEEGRTEAPGKSTIIWRKLNGQWKAVVMSFSMDTPPGPSTD
jgi:ketosteroid isomerase-like protein